MKLFLDSADPKEIATLAATGLVDGVTTNPSLAAKTGKPRGLRWVDCEWSDGAEFVRDRKSGQIAAFVGVTIQFEAIPGSDMEGLPAVGNLRNASAVFFFLGGHWQTVGNVLFNKNPDEAVVHFHNQYERLT